MLKLDYKNVDKTFIGEENGLEIENIFQEFQYRISEIITDLNKRKDKPGQWLQWLNLGYSEETLWFVKEYAAIVKNRFENVLILGVGGSALGGIAMSEALLKPYWNMLSKEERDNNPRIFFLDNIDPDQMSSLLNSLNLEKTLVNVITKSGTTAETMAQYMIVANMLQEKLGDDYRKNIVVTTDKELGLLRQLANQEGYKNFVIPDDVGGRYSVFSAVGLLPLALVGIDIDEIINGVKDMDLALKNTDIHNNIAAQCALIHYIYNTRKNKNILVMMPYSSRLKYVADWFVQLWAESLGKNIDNDGNPINTGLTPIKSVGVTDQHSQIQLFNEGPNDKIIDFIRIEEFDNNLDIPKIFEYTGIGYLGGKTINQLFDAEADATKMALLDFNRPNITITLPKINGYYLGQLLYMLEVQTAIAGALYNINAFDQPGVEQAKNYTYALMGRTGYEDSANNLKERLALI